MYEYNKNGPPRTAPPSLHQAELPGLWGIVTWLF